MSPNVAAVKLPKAATPASGDRLQLQRRCTCGAHTHGSGRCARCAAAQAGLQGKAGADDFEQEADRLAARTLSTSSAKNEEAVPVKPVTHRGMTAGMPADVVSVLRTSGAPLAKTLRNDMEQRFGHDFSQVRVHTDSGAAQSAATQLAQAYTVGSHIVFGADRFSPHGAAGRHLLAHELTHVLQQRAMPALQRQPLDDAGGSASAIVDGGIDQSTSAGSAAGSGSGPVSDAGAGSAAATPAAPQGSAAVAPLPTRVPSNEAEAIEDTAKFYPDDSAVTAAIASVAPQVQKELGTDVEYQRKFLYRCSLYLGPHPNTVDHFKGIAEFTFADSTKLSLHQDTINKLAAVQRVIGAKYMPSSGTGFALRQLIRQAPVAFPGMMVHAMGYAIDFRAANNPHFKDPRLVAVQALYTTGATTFHQSTGTWKQRRETIRKMGAGELDENSKEQKDFLAELDTEGQRDSAGNQAITHQLPASELAELKSLRTQYKEFQKQKKVFDAHLAAAKKKLKKGESFDLQRADIIRAMLNPDQSERGKLISEMVAVGAKRFAIVERTREILHDLISKADVEIQKMRKLPHVTDSDKDYKAALAQLSKASADAKRAVAAADLDLKHTRSVLAQHVKAEARLDTSISKERRPAQLAKLQTQRTEEERKKNEAATANTASAANRVSVATREAQAAASLDDAQKAKDRRVWVQNLEGLQSGLSDAGFDPRLVFGIGDADAEADRSVRDPSLVQLFSRGFFNIDQPAPVPAPATPPAGGAAGPSKAAPKGAAKPSTKATAPAPLHGFDLHFMEEMAKHGFDQGAEWTPGGVDSMHFEDVASVDAMHTPTDAKRS